MLRIVFNHDIFITSVSTSSTTLFDINIKYDINITQIAYLKCAPSTPPPK